MSGAKRSRSQMHAMSETVEVVAADSPVVRPTAHADISSDSEDFSLSASFEDRCVVPLEMSDSAAGSPRRKKFRQPSVASYDEEEESYEEESGLSANVLTNDNVVNVSLANAAVEVASIVSSSAEDALLSGDIEDSEASSCEEEDDEEEDDVEDVEDNVEDNVEDVEEEEEDDVEEDDVEEEEVDVEEEEVDVEEDDEEESETEESVIIIDDDEDDDVLKDASAAGGGVDKCGRISQDAVQSVAQRSQGKAVAVPCDQWMAFKSRTAQENRSKAMSARNGNIPASCQPLPSLPSRKGDTARSPKASSPKLPTKPSKAAPSTSSTSTTSLTPSSLKKTRNSPTPSSASSRTKAPPPAATGAVATAVTAAKKNAPKKSRRIPAVTSTRPHSTTMRKGKGKSNSLPVARKDVPENKASPPCGAPDGSNAAWNSLVQARKKPLMARDAASFDPLPGFKVPGTLIRCESTRLPVMSIRLSLMSAKPDCTCVVVSHNDDRERQGAVVFTPGFHGKRDPAADAQSSTPGPASSQKSLSTTSQDPAKSTQASRNSRTTIPAREEVPPTARIRVSENPKKHGSQAWLRYEQYKVARTKQEYFDLGGISADWLYDVSKGFVQVLD